VPIHFILSHFVVYLVVCHLPSEGSYRGCDVSTLLLQIQEVSSQVYLQQNKKKAEAKGENCHAKTMWSLEKPI